MEKLKDAHFFGPTAENRIRMEAKSQLFHRGGPSGRETKKSRDLVESDTFVDSRKLICSLATLAEIFLIKFEKKTAVLQKFPVLKVSSRGLVRFAHQKKAQLCKKAQF